MRQDHTLAYVLIALLAIILFGGFGMMGFGGMGGMMGYGNPFLCSEVGGIWCYFPVFGFFFMILFWVALVLFIVWIVRHIQGQNRKGR